MPAPTYGPEGPGPFPLPERRPAYHRARADGGGADLAPKHPVAPLPYDHLAYAPVEEGHGARGHVAPAPQHAALVQVNAGGPRSPGHGAWVSNTKLVLSLIRFCDVYRARICFGQAQMLHDYV